jgi:multidrug efflux pump subunit AcrB
MTSPTSSGPEQQALGISGLLAKSFQNSALTPLLALLGLLLGFFAIMVTPKEEEPQIDVTFANVFIAYPGASAKEVEQVIAIPAQQVLSEIAGVDDIFSISQPGMAVLTVAFEVGIPRQEAILNLYNQVESHKDWFPPNLRVPEPVIKPMGIDDVPIMALTLWSDNDQLTQADLTRVAHTLESELKTVPGTRDIYTLGEHNQVLNIRLNPGKMNGHGLSFSDVRQRLMVANNGGQLAPMVSNNEVIKIQAGAFLQSTSDVANLVMARYQNQNGQGLVYLRDIASIELQADTPDNYVFIQSQQTANQLRPAVTIAIAKQPGMNAVDITNAISERLAVLQNRLIPADIKITETRNYGLTAAEKSNQLIGKLLFATAAVVLLVLLAMSWREAIIVGGAIIITLAITLFASWVWGFTLNRVSLFALIFSIGILVDDAIVVVENIHRHIHLRQQKGEPVRLLQLIPEAVEEVGGPTILATFTVIAALMPMAFVSGLMGPYMSPIPINASTGMMISLIVAFIATPWLSYKLMKRQYPDSAEANNQPQAPHHDDDASSGKLYDLFNRIMRPMLEGPQAGKKRLQLFLATLGLILMAVALPAMKVVVLKMLPFDNKSEFQVVVDMPEGTTAEQTLRVLQDLSDYLITVPEVKDLELYSGSAAPINFNGLVRQYYLREQPHHGDIQVNLLHKSLRDRQSHDIALSVREQLQAIGKPYNANVKVVEVPPGPPVMAPIVAEVYGSNYEQQLDAAKQLTTRFANTQDVVDTDNWIDAPQKQLDLIIDRSRAMLFGVAETTINQAINAALRGEDVSYLHSETQKYPLPLRMRFDEASRSDMQQLLTLKVRSQSGELISLSELVKVEHRVIEQTIYHKNQRPVMFVTADMAGPLDSPLYGLFDIAFGLQDSQPDWNQFYIQAPQTSTDVEIKWDGEWQITYETFRDMGMAYGVGMILIYLLVVAQFRSYAVPLVIMAPIPLTIIGVMPGHALFDAQFTATSMIGMIALAGIIVRNSILLVDFINQQVALGVRLEEAVIQSAAVRSKPIALTGLAAMIGAFFILDDPIFNGLAISLVFGILVSTLLTLVLIPVLYFLLQRKPSNP